MDEKVLNPLGNLTPLQKEAMEELEQKVRTIDQFLRAINSTRDLFQD